MSEALQRRAKKEGWPTTGAYEVMDGRTGLTYVFTNGLWCLKPIDRRPLPYWKNAHA